MIIYHHHFYHYHYYPMSGTGEKHQLSQLMKNLQEMLRVLGEDTGQSLTVKMDEFEYLRKDFTEAAQVYEKSTFDLSYTSDKKQRGILIYEISRNRQVMDESLRRMTNLVVKMNAKIKENNYKNKNKNNIKQGEQKMETELQYKNLTIFNLEKHYFKLTRKEPKEASKSNKNKYYPDQETLEELLKNRPEHRGFTERSDHESSEYLEEKEILETIKMIDDRIEQKMDFILSGLQMINYNALTIRDGIDEVQRKILINVDKLNDNMEQLQQAEDLLDEAAPNASKPNCVMNVIIVILLGILAYLIVRKLLPETADNQDNISN